MTRKEAARQLGIPEGSVASRLARARALLAKRLARRGVVFSGSVAAVLSARSASASAPPALVASTIKAASLLAAGQAAGVLSTKVAALTEGLVQAMFVTRINSVLVVVLVVGLAFAGAAGLLYQTQAADQPQDAPKKAEEKPVPAQPNPQPAKTDRERMVGNWFIINDDSQRKGEMWVITEDSILMHAKHLGVNAHHYAHRLDASKTPKQIDITVSRVNGPTVGVIHGIYVLDGDELRLCLGEMSKDRPAAFPEKPKPGEVLILQRATSGATTPEPKGRPFPKKDQEEEKGRPMTKEEPTPKNSTQVQKVLTPEEAIKQMPKENVTVQFKVAKVEAMPNPASGFGGPTYYIFLQDGGKFTARLAKAADQFMDKQYIKLGIKPGVPLSEEKVKEAQDAPAKHFGGKVVRVTGRIEPDSGNSSFQMWVRDLADIELVEEKPSEKQSMTKEGKLRMLIDKVLVAHGGEDKLSKLQFTMTVKRSNGETQQYFVHPPMNFRLETTHRDRTGKHIGILFPYGWREWTNEPNQDAKELFPLGQLGTRPPTELLIDEVRFVGPRQVLRLRDTNHRVTLLEEEAKIDGRAAVGVEVTGLFVFKGKMYFDKDTHLLLKSGSVTYSDYKKFDGISVAQKVNNGSLMSQVTDFRTVARLDAKLFEQP
jgi:uncharacterized protein (TIGR03067 family)